MPRRCSVRLSSFLRSSYARRLRAEQLEDRRLLATVAVGNTLDVVNAPDTSSIAALIANDGGDGVSLREAITAANNTAGADTITFDAGVFAGGGTITLGGTQLQVADGLTIDASGLTGPVTIDANQQSRVINFTAGAGLTLRGLTITGGRVTGANMDGGGIRASSGGTVTLEQSSVIGNDTVSGDGGGIFANGAVTLTDSAVNDNTANGPGGTNRRGGGIYAGGDVTLTRSVVNGNSLVNASFDASGGGIASDGDVTLTESTVSGNRVQGNGPLGGSNGGGIHVDNTAVTIIDSTVSGNESLNGPGGGIHAIFGTITLTRSTLSGNQASTTGGGIDTGAFRDLTITGSTISGNQSGTDGGGIYFGQNNVLIQNSTITGNTAGGVGGGIGGDGQFGVSERFTLLNSIVAGNSDNGTAPDVLLPPEPVFFDFIFTVVRFSLVGDNTGAALVEAQTADADGNLVGSPSGAGVIDAQLGPLADNGGPTQTHALMPGGPASNAGDPAFDPSDFTPSQDFDQRGPGFDRVLFGRVDLGAFESSLPPQGLLVSTITDVVDGDFSVGELSLREAILLANGSFGADTITFDPAVFAGGGAITLGGTQLQVTEELTIDASGLTGPVTIDANQQSRVINFTADEGDLTLRGLTITGGRVTGFDEDGGGIRFGGSGLSGTLTLDRSTVSGNSATGGFADGGGIATVSGDLSLTESTVSGNLSNTSGGGLFADSGSVTVVSSTVSRNRTTIAQNTGNSVGGGIGTVTGNVTLISSTVSENTAKTNGGGVGTISGDVGIINSTVTGNHSDDDGGGLHVLDSSADPSLTISNSIVAGNTADGAAPDLRFDTDGFVSISSSLIGDTLGSGVTVTTGTNNLLNTDARIGPLADNGGPTPTHALLVGSPAINAGASFFATDQRGFARNAAGGVDIGAYEAQGIVIRTPGDYNGDNTVDAADYTVWRDSLGATGLAPLSGADGDGDGEVTQADNRVWRTHFGFEFTPPASSVAAVIDVQPSEALIGAGTSSPELIKDAALQAFVKLPTVSAPVRVLRIDPPALQAVDDALLLAFATQSGIASSGFGVDDPDEITPDEAFVAKEEREAILAIALSAF